jgi:polyisoprenoid-binding protein YceI
MNISRRRRRWLWGVAIAAGVVVILAIAGPLVYIHLIEGTPPAKLALTPATTEGSSGSGAASIAGRWTVGKDSTVGYRVTETLVGQHTTAVGRTSDVTGAVVISGTTVGSASFTAQMATVKSDQSHRDDQFRGRIMDVATYPTASFVLSKPFKLDPVPTAGTVGTYEATGSLTLHGQTHSVTFPINAERSGKEVAIQGSIGVVFAQWGIPNPSIGSVVRTADHGSLEFLLHLQTGS